MIPAGDGSGLRAATTVPGWAVLALGTVRLAFPQWNVHRVELARDLAISTQTNNPECGTFTPDGGSSWPAYSLNDSLQLELPPAAERRLAVFVFLKDAVRGILCDYVRSLEADDDLAVEPVPACAGDLRLVATGLARFEDGVVLVADPVAFADYLLALIDQFDGKS